MAKQSKAHANGSTLRNGIRHAVVTDIPSTATDLSLDEFAIIQPLYASAVQAFGWTNAAERLP